MPENLQEKYLLSDDEKQEILAAFAEEIKDISDRRGYKAQDVISLSENTPNLEQLLQNFQQEHHHTDDEVRFIVSGHGVFIIQGKDGEFFEVFLNPGDLISVPENIRHYFTLQEDRKVVAIRIFVTAEGWVPIYEKRKFINNLMTHPLPPALGFYFPAITIGYFFNILWSCDFFIKSR